LPPSPLTIPLLSDRYAHRRALHSFPTRRSSDLDKLVHAYGAPVTVDYDIDDIAVSTDNATPLALLTNEVLTNSLKYAFPDGRERSEEHTSELQSRENLVCRLLLEKKKKQHKKST